MAPDSASLPSTLSTYYPLLLVLLFLAAVGVVFIMFVVRAVFKLVRSQSYNKYADSSPLVKPLASRETSKSFWAQVFLVVQQQIFTKDNLEYQRLAERYQELSREMQALRNIQANGAVRGEALETARQVLEARLRATDAKLTKEKAVRIRLERRSEELDSELKRLHQEVSRTYEKGTGMVSLTTSNPDQSSLLRAGIQVREAEIERLKGLLLRAESEIRRLAA